jgi:ParB family chromosome partitioning protein
LNDSRIATELGERHQAWRNALPKEASDLWEALADFDTDSRQALFAHCVSLSVNAMFEAYNRRPKALAHADRLAQAVDLDMVAAGWTPTVAGYLGRVTKARILGAVREAKGERAAQLVDHLKKVEMAAKAETLLDGSGWLPEPLRTPGRALPPVVDTADIEASAIDPDPTTEAAGEETAADGGESAIDQPDASVEDDSVEIEPHAIAAE